ncbi:aminotransferase class V-fold PLP-dependent enzyme [Rhizobium redzepovicii]|uniref:Aminotransferase class V-fold PLP-dependent enzyme n=1 Tax=Rhizobium redzepovicii TaxID=2867518 RepID=A0AAW8PFF3_9HYPH|nr:aminotransferase class V-fold PLP-dependent enzyme [Rhizobium redzepovicii]MDR9764113.1 aminotransferase class V-fold PLP-dependent enzyme [Rhizobium redzepovicii]
MHELAERYPSNELSTVLGKFKSAINQGDPIARFRAGLIGSKARVDGPFGPKDLVYADYVASGRALRQIEEFILEDVLPYYANSHTEASYCGGMMTRLRREARSVIGELCGADRQHAVIFAGSGATAGLNRLVNLLGVTDAIAAGKTVRVVLGPYEHHSNILPWRESGAEVIEIAEGNGGGPDPLMLQKALANAPAGLTICSFSAASNVTGILTDVAALTKIAKATGAKVVWDYAGAGPYVPMAMTPEPDAEIDAIVVSPHKFVGGPGASGVLVVRHDAVVTSKPSWPGGGTVKFVSPMGHDYSDSLESREEAGTPNVIGDIRAALAFLVKDAIGLDEIKRLNDEFTRRALAAWKDVAEIELLGSTSTARLPIFSFRVRDGKGGYIHQQLVTRMLSDRFGIQARGGCACAGPYVHRLLSIDTPTSQRLRQAILDGNEIEKPGFTRLNLSVLASDETVSFILDSVAQLARDASAYVEQYTFDPARAIFSPIAAVRQEAVCA